MRFNTDEFDCFPPPEAMDELRSRRFRPPTPPPRKSSRLEEARKFVNTAVLGASGLAFIFAMMVVVASVLFNRAKEETRPVPAPTPAAVAPTPRSYVYGPPPTVPAPRAELAVKRATFVGLPVGWRGSETMPDGSIIPVTYKGEVGYFDSLPRNPALGDMWKVLSSGASWVWYTPAGFSAPAWVDP